MELSSVYDVSFNTQSNLRRKRLVRGSRLREFAKGQCHPLEKTQIHARNMALCLCSLGIASFLSRVWVPGLSISVPQADLPKAINITALFHAHLRALLMQNGAGPEILGRNRFV